MLWRYSKPQEEPDDLYARTTGCLPSPHSQPIQAAQSVRVCPSKRGGVCTGPGLLRHTLGI